MCSNDDIIRHFETKEHFLPSESPADKPPSSHSPLPRVPWPDLALDEINRANTVAGRPPRHHPPMLRGMRTRFKPTWGFCQYFICVTHISSKYEQTKPQCFIRSCNSLHLSYHLRLPNPTRAVGICVQDNRTLLVASGLIALTALEGLEEAFVSTLVFFLIHLQLF